MGSYRIWAPFASTVTLKLEPCGTELPMTACRGGFFELDDPRIISGKQYWFLLDGRGPFPDPRSRSQPLGVHGPSCFIDLNEFSWTDSHFVATPFEHAVLYELHVGTFSNEGTFDGVAAHLDELGALGITHIQLMPVNHFPGERGWGYDGVFLFAPHSAYGGVDGLRRLVNACHARGIGVILDVVYNHLGPTGNYLGRFGPYFTQKYQTPWGQAINFDGRGSDEVRRFFIDNALDWLEHFHIDGLRLDATHAIYDQTASPILSQIAAAVSTLGQRLGKDLVLIAEDCQNDVRVVRSPDLGGHGFTSQWNEDFHHAMHALLTGEQAGYFCDYSGIADLAQAIAEGFVYQGQYFGYRGRAFGSPSRGLTGKQLINYIQNHDQVGNRSDGARLYHLLTLGQQKIAAALLLLSVPVPMLFMGEEWGCPTRFYFFVDLEDARLGSAVKAGREREFREFGWPGANTPDPAGQESFLMSKIDWSTRDTPSAQSLLDWYRRLIEMRSAYFQDRGDSLDQAQVSYSEPEQWLQLRRGPLRIVAYFGSGGWSFDRGRGAVLLDSRENTGTESFLVPGVVVLED